VSPDYVPVIAEIGRARIAHRSFADDERGLARCSSADGRVTSFELTP